MSIVQNTLIGRARQKIGGSVFSTWKGLNVLKSKPLTVANPKTPGQIQQRSAMSQITKLFRGASGYVALGFKQQAVHMSEFNAFASYNLKNAFNKAVSGVATLVPLDLLFSQGTITKTIPVTVSASLALHFEITWDASGTLPPGVSNSDVCQYFGYNSTKGTFSTVNSGDLWSDTDSDLPTIPTDWAIGDTVFLYMFFYNPTSRKSSDSVVTQKTIIA